MEADPILQLEDVSTTFGTRTVFRTVNLELRADESVAIMGQSGVGKTSLLNMVLGLVAPTKGRIMVGGEPLPRSAQARKSRVHRESVGAIFQNGELLHALNAVENVAFPLLLRGVSSKEAFFQASELLSAVEVSNVDVPSMLLSGGERQRVALARALITHPRLVLGDEPTGSLDGSTRDMVANLLFTTVKAQGSALLVVTHDPEIARRADRVACLHPEGLEWVQQ